MEVRARGLAFTHADGPEAARLWYRERARPLRRLGALVREILAATPRFSVESIGAPERLVTCDGEHAALVTVCGTEAGAPAQRDLGFVFADDFFSSVGSLCLVDRLRADVTALVRELVLRDVHALGVRRRRFEYPPPDGWQPIARGLATEWFPPDYPANHTAVVAYPANPIELVHDVTLDKVAAATVERIDERCEPQPVASASGLLGEAQVLRATDARGRALARETVLLRDSRYIYAVELTSYDVVRWEAHRAVLAALVRGIQPVPGPTAVAAAAGIMSHWLD
jgi:hypothetical protein